MKTLSCVVSENIYTPQNYVGIMTDKYYCFEQEDTIQEIHDLLQLNGVETDTNPLWDYPLIEIEHIVENNHQVVLVDCSGFYEKDEIQQMYRWFEVGDDAYKFIDEE